MWLLHKNSWRPGYLAYARPPGELRIEVVVWLRLSSLQDMYFSPRPTLRKALAYSRTVGPIQLARKVNSRLRESRRNDKYLSFGVGRVVEADNDGELRVGTTVCFLAPCHPACVSEVVLPARLVRPGDFEVEESEGCLWEGDLPFGSADASAVGGWIEQSGRQLEIEAVGRILDQALKRFSDLVMEENLTRREVESEGDPPATESRANPGRKRSSKPTAVLFGLGHYAKNIVMPRVSKSLDLVVVHEIDPAQLGPEPSSGSSPWRARTSPMPIEGEQYDVFVVAGYHHTHAPITIEALSQGAAVIVEKPIATTLAQVDALEQALAGSPKGRIFVGFPRRYSPFTGYLSEDLGLQEGAPVHCQALVYEVALPWDHWYRWPVSGGKVISNGCHWIDYFLFVNRFSSVETVEASSLPNGDAVVLVSLANGACLVLVITDHGSPRVGVRETIEFRAEDRTARIVDQATYVAENGHRVLRRKSVSRAKMFGLMYSKICQRIVHDLPGDHPEALFISARTAIEADRLYRESLNSLSGT